VLQATCALTVTIFAIVFIASTIAKRLRARERELEEAYFQLHAADETKSFFMRKAGHEMRAPLSAIHSILDALEISTEQMPDRHRRLIGRAKSLTRALLAMVTDLRRYSRLRQSPTGTTMGRVALGNIVRNTAELFREQADAAGIELNCSARPVWVRGDEELLREVVTNLLANAIQYTPSGGRIDLDLNNVALSTDTHGDDAAVAGTIPTGPAAVLTVADTGIGISDQARERIFDDFYRAPEARETFLEGTGLGLAITRRIVQMHGGSIEARSRAEGGTVFTVRLALRGASAGQPEPRREED
jgi:signal transduction histidine kinase